MAQKRSRGGIQKRGGFRGRGRGGRVGRRFDTVRLSEQKDESDSEQEHELSGDEESQDGISSGDESEEEPTTKPYLALMQSFAETTGPKLKKRKLDPSVDAEGSSSKPGDSQAATEGPGQDAETQDDKDPDFVQEEAGEEVDEDVEMEVQHVVDDAYEGDHSDPFESHFANIDEAAVGGKVKAIQENGWGTKRSVTKSSRVVTTFPKDRGSEDPPAVSQISSLDGVKLKQRLKESTKFQLPELDGVQKDLASMLFNYQDILYCQRTVGNSESLRKTICLHALNHVFKTRDRVLKNNAKLAKEGPDADLELRDQGFTRPKILFLLPTRNSCAKIIKTISSLAAPEQQENKARFDDAYVEKSSSFTADRPSDFKDLFDGNDDDMFRLGMLFTRTTVKYFAPFYRSDILLASPLGLRMAIGSEEDTDKRRKTKVDFDFLSSIEMVVVDQADALLMQNWEHVEYIFEHMNLHPRESHDLDISRVRPWYLDNWAKFFRQTVVLSAFNTPELSELTRLHCHNWAGKVRLQPEYAGEIQQLGIRTKQTFTRFDSSSIEQDPEARFAYFTAATVPYLLKRAKDSSGTLIFIPSYLDFVRVRNYFATNSAVASLSFGTISEYADVREASRARSHFTTGRHKVLLYTERAHHFRRYRIKGVQRVFFYALPDNPIFYREIAGGYLGMSEGDMSLQPGTGVVRGMFSKYDALKLERIVGSGRVGKMLRDRGDTFDFV